MSTNDQLYRLLTWMSPAYPIGSYAYSHGLESAVDMGLINDTVTTHAWISDLLRFGNGQADLVFLAAAWHAANDPERLRHVHDLALAFQSTSEIRLETTAQGAAFLKTTAAAWPCDAITLLQGANYASCAYPVAVGAVARCHAIESHAMMVAYAHAFAANLVSAAVRLVPLGQTDSQKITAMLLSTVETAIAKANVTPLHEISSNCLMADITSMRHEVQYTRLFRS